jgi:hypothetical protein
MLIFLNCLENHEWIQALQKCDLKNDLITSGAPFDWYLMLSTLVKMLKQEFRKSSFIYLTQLNKYWRNGSLIK